MAHRIKSLRKEKGLTLLQVAERLGVTESTVQRYESGNIKNLKYETMVELAELFDVAPSYLMGWTSEDSTKADREMMELVGLFQKLNDCGKAEALTRLQEMTSLEKYTKNNLPCVPSTQERLLQVGSVVKRLNLPSIMIAHFHSERK
jgi:transcriptional regulator with XRE-family HTH domain